MTAIPKTEQILLRVPSTLKEQIETAADADGMPVNEWATKILRAHAGSRETESKAMAAQHKAAREVLPFIFAATREHRTLTYGTAAKAIGRDPRTNGRFMGGVTDLLDAACAKAGVPMLALYTVRSNTGEINPEAFGKLPELREALLNEARTHVFTEADIAAIGEALDFFHNKKMGRFYAWRHIKETNNRFRNLLIPETNSDD